MTQKHGTRDTYSLGCKRQLQGSIVLKNFKYLLCYCVTSRIYPLILSFNNNALKKNSVQVSVLLCFFFVCFETLLFRGLTSVSWSKKLGLILFFQIRCWFHFIWSPIKLENYIIWRHLMMLVLIQFIKQNIFIACFVFHARRD